MPVKTGLRRLHCRGGRWKVSKWKFLWKYPFSIKCFRFSWGKNECSQTEKFCWAWLQYCNFRVFVFSTKTWKSSRKNFDDNYFFFHFHGAGIVIKTLVPYAHRGKGEYVAPEFFQHWLFFFLTPMSIPLYFYLVPSHPQQMNSRTCEMLGLLLTAVCSRH